MEGTIMAAIMALFLIVCVSQALVSGNCALNIFSSNLKSHERAGSRVHQVCNTRAEPTGNPNPPRPVSAGPSATPPARAL